MSVDITDGSVSSIRHKIVFIGDVGVGKTSVMQRFVENKFKEIYDPTIGIDFFSKIINYDGHQLKLQIWDSAGQERYKSLIPSYIKGASIIFIVYDVSKIETFENVQNWIDFVKNSKNTDSILVLCGNKIDLTSVVPYSSAENLSKKENLLFYEVSAKTNQNLEKMCFSVITHLPFFDQFERDKEQICHELIEENADPSNDNSLKLNNSAVSKKGQNVTLKVKDKDDRVITVNNDKKQGCKC